MHIVSLKKGLSVEQAKADPEGIAVLGFFLNVRGWRKKNPEMYKWVIKAQTDICVEFLAQLTLKWLCCIKATEGGDTSGPWFELVSYLGNLTGTATSFFLIKTKQIIF